MGLTCFTQYQCVLSVTKVKRSSGPCGHVPREQSIADFRPTAAVRRDSAPADAFSLTVPQCWHFHLLSCRARLDAPCLFHERHASVTLFHARIHVALYN